MDDAGPGRVRTAGGGRRDGRGAGRRRGGTGAGRRRPRAEPGHPAALPHHARRGARGPRRFPAHGHRRAAARCAFRAGDFADVPAGGDVYVLSRVLHDWDDDRCREILRHCARAMHESADLLVVERVLPADGSASPATAWDLHMMCNVGGRERRADHYARLFADAGLTLVGRTPLPWTAACCTPAGPGRRTRRPGSRCTDPRGCRRG
ncbi:methyltransferase [Streptomyces sp. NBC_00386]